MQPHVFLSLSDVINRNRKRAESVTSHTSCYVVSVTKPHPSWSILGTKKQEQFPRDVPYCVLCPLLWRACNSRSEFWRGYIFL